MSTTIPLPREHGVYVVLLGSWIIGILLKAPGTWWPPLFSMVVLLAMLMIPNVTRSFTDHTRKRTRAQIAPAFAAAIAATVLAITAVIVAPVLVMLVPVGLAFVILLAYMKKRRRPMQELSFVAFMTIALGVPVAGILNGSQDFVLLGLGWFMCAAFFCGSSLNVAIRLRRTKRSLYTTGLYHGLVLLLWSLVAGSFPAYYAGLAGLALNMLRFAWIVNNASLFRTRTLKRIGLEETALTTIFLLMNIP
jgi:hypothetical protein